MSKGELSETVYMVPDCCEGCVYRESERATYCPTNVAYGSMVRIRTVVEREDSVPGEDTVEDAFKLVDQLPMLSDAAEQCGENLVAGQERPAMVTTDMSLTNFMVHASGVISRS